ncbi:MAG: hypothetical protein K0S56_2330, partial [Microvirga sp.]|nr:hypothetical protein [Microvirga sp.]
TPAETVEAKFVKMGGMNGHRRIFQSE